MPSWCPRHGCYTGPEGGRAADDRKRQGKRDYDTEEPASSSSISNIAVIAFPPG